MKRRLGLRGVSIACLAGAVFFLTHANVLSAANNDTHFKREPIMDNLYPILFANTLQNNLTLATVHAVGKEAWRKRRAEIELGAAGYLLVSHSTVFTVAVERITAIDANGKELWSHNKWTNSPVFLFDKVLYCQSYRSDDKLERIDLHTGTILKADIALPLTGGKEKNIFFEPHENDFIACSQLPASQVLKGGKPQSYPPHYSIYREPYDVWDFIWIAGEMEKIVFPIIHLRDKKLLCVGTSQSMVLYNSAPSLREPQPVGRFNFPLSHTKKVCADGNEMLYFAGKSQKAEELVCCDDKGKVHWKWQRAGITESTVPLVAGSNGEIILVSGRTICCVKDGKLIWELSTGLQDPKYMTATSDGCALVAAGDVLYCCKDGNEIFSFDAGSTIIAPPVVDADGCIYLLTPTEVIKVL